MQNVQYQTKLSPSYPQSYPQKGVTNCKICSTPCKIHSTQYKIRSTPCKTCSTPCKIRSSYLQNTQYKTKLSPSYPQSYPQKGVTNCKICSTPCKIHSTQYKIRSTPCKTCSTPCKIRSSYLQNTQYKTKLSPSYPQWICRRKIDLKNKSKCFILT